MITGKCKAKNLKEAITRAWLEQTKELKLGDFNKSKTKGG